MLNPGLTPADFERYLTGLMQPHTMRILVEILDLDQRHISHVTGTVLSGQVDVDTDGDVDRTLALTVLDSGDELNLDSSESFTAGRFLDRMIRVRYGVHSPSLPRWVDVPIFTGPINSMSRDDDVVSLTAAGKESMLMGPASTHLTWAKGSYKTTVLKGILNAFGEQFVDIPHVARKVPKALSIAPATIPWAYLKSVAGSWGYGRIVYDGRGYATFRGGGGQNVWTFQGGNGGSLLSKPKVAYDIADVRNFIVVFGAPPEGNKKAVSATAMAPLDHPFGPSTLGRGGARRYLREDITDDNISTQKEAQKLADDTLQRRLLSAIQMDFSSMVIPTLEPYDIYTVDSGTWNARATLRKFTIPLTADGNMSIGRRHTVKGASRSNNRARKSPRR